jgi:hypothetical protein
MISSSGSMSSDNLVMARRGAGAETELIGDEVGKRVFRGGVPPSGRRDASSYGDGAGSGFLE